MKEERQNRIESAYWSKSQAFRDGLKIGLSGNLLPIGVHITHRIIPTSGQENDGGVRLQPIPERVDRREGYIKGYSSFLRDLIRHLDELDINFPLEQVFTHQRGYSGLKRGIELDKPDPRETDNIPPTQANTLSEDQQLESDGYRIGFVVAHLQRGILVRKDQIPKDNVAFGHYKDGRAGRVIRPIHDADVNNNHHVRTNNLGISFWLHEHKLPNFSADLFDMPGVIQAFRFMIENPDFKLSGNFHNSNLPPFIADLPGAFKGAALGAKAQEILRRKQIDLQTDDSSMLK